LSRQNIPILLFNDSSTNDTYIQTFHTLSAGELTQWVKRQHGTGVSLAEYSEQNCCVTPAAKTGSASLAVIGQPLDTVDPLDGLLNACNTLLAEGGTICCMAVPSAVKQERLRNMMPWGVRRTAVGLHYLWHRVGAKMRLTRNLYHLVTGGHHRSMSRVEILGRMKHAGFDISEQRMRNGVLALQASRHGQPITEHPHTEAIIGLPRIGKDGNLIRVYKVRTMYAYSEFLQEEMYTRHHLTKGGKIARDYRITTPGRWLRSHWLDEWPMLFNLLRGEIKLVGVRPLSEHYFHLYSEEMQTLRTQCKPGLLPPFYADRGNIDSLDDIQANERRYLEAYRRHPLRTDWHYLCLIMGNIMLHHKRSA